MHYHLKGLKDIAIDIDIGCYTPEAEKDSLSTNQQPYFSSFVIEGLHTDKQHN